MTTPPDHFSYVQTFVAQCSDYASILKNLTRSANGGKLCAFYIPDSNASRYHLSIFDLMAWVNLRT